MRDVVFSAILIAAAVGLIFIVRLLTSDFRPSCPRPRADMTVYFDSGCECLEYILEKIYSSSALRGLDLHITVADRIATPESGQWLEALRKKLKRDFDIVPEEKSGGTE